MSLPDLLRHVSARVPRAVAIDGRLITGSAAVSAAAAGTATLVMPHTNHGGVQGVLDAPSPAGTARYARAWWNADTAARDADVAAVSRAFPGFAYDGSDGGHRFEGVIDTGRGRFRVAVVGNPDGGLPRVVPVQPRAMGRVEGRGFRRPEHVYTNGNLCVAAEEDWLPGYGTVVAIAWAANWYASYTDWRLGGPWVSDGYRPDVR